MLFDVAESVVGRSPSRRRAGNARILTALYTAGTAALRFYERIALTTVTVTFTALRHQDQTGDFLDSRLRI